MTKPEESVSGLPSFDDIDDVELRAMNRGAILANLFEDYYQCLGTDSYTFKNLIRRQNNYLAGLSPDDHRKAKQAMNIHLAKRGYKFGS